METQKQVVHFQAKKGFTTAQSIEHQRRWTEKGWERANENGRIDRTRTRLNFEIVQGGKVQAVDQSKSIVEKFHRPAGSRIPTPVVPMTRNTGPSWTSSSAARMSA